MASALAIANISVQQRLREIIHRAITAIWRGLSNYDEENVDPFIRAAVPVVLAGQRKSVALTETYVARALERPPFGVDVDTLVGPSVRNGIQPEAQWRRPFVTTWSALQEGKQWEDAVVMGLDRATQMAETDVQLSSRATFQAVQDADDRIFGYQRVARADACPFCRAVDGAYVKSAMAMGLHPHCGCTLEALLDAHPRAVFLPDGTRIREHQFGPLIDTPLPADVVVHEHGELGATLADPAHSYLSEADIRAAQMAVFGKDGLSKLQQVYDTLAGTMAAHPKFEVLKPVVVPDPVLVMHGLGGFQSSPKALLHNVTMLKNVGAFARCDSSQDDVALGVL